MAKNLVREDSDEMLDEDWEWVKRLLPAQWELKARELFHLQLKAVRLRRGQPGRQAILFVDSAAG